jgi:hypothetical protein
MICVSLSSKAWTSAAYISLSSQPCCLVEVCLPQ